MTEREFLKSACDVGRSILQMQQARNMLEDIANGILFADARLEVNDGDPSIVCTAKTWESGFSWKINSHWIKVKRGEVSELEKAQRELEDYEFADDLDEDVSNTATNMLKNALSSDEEIRTLIEKNSALLVEQRNDQKALVEESARLEKEKRKLQSNSTPKKPADIVIPERKPVTQAEFNMHIRKRKPLKPLSVLSMIGIIIFGALLVDGFANPQNKGLNLPMGIATAVSVGVYVLTKIRVKKWKESEWQTFNQQRDKEHEDEVNRLKAEYEKELQAYNEAHAAEAQAQASIDALKQRTDSAQGSVDAVRKAFASRRFTVEGDLVSMLNTEWNALEAKIEELLEIQKRLYDTDILFSKYRRLNCITTMLEYFESGRCSTLTGPDGAYNLYEQELRANLIISNLQEINSKLDQIKANQYLLYTVVTDMNRTLKTINRELCTQTSLLADMKRGIASMDRKMDTVTDNQQKIMKNQEAQTHIAALTAVYAAATAANTEAIKYLSLVN